MKYKRCLIFLLVLGLAGSAMAAELHVGSGQTYADIGSAYLACSAWDTITVHAGTYAPPALNNNDAKDGVTIRAYQSGGVYDDVYINDRIYLRYKDDITIQGLIFANIANYAMYVRNDASTHVDRLTVKDCIFYGGTRTQLYQYASSDSYTAEDFLIENNTFYLASEIAGLELYRATVNATVKDNLFLYSTGTYSTTIPTPVSGDGYGYGIRGNRYSGNNPTVVNYNGFYGNEEGPVDGLVVTLGTGNVLTVDPAFDNTTVGGPNFMWLDETCSSLIVNGASDGGYLGARPQVPEPATLALLGLGGLALLRKKR